MLAFDVFIKIVHQIVRFNSIENNSVIALYILRHISRHRADVSQLFQTMTETSLDNNSILIKVGMTDENYHMRELKHFVLLIIES